MKRTKIILTLLIAMAMYAQGQETEELPVFTDKTSLGIGIGLDYGGIGGNLLYYPHKNVGVFAGVGHALAGLGYNIGVKARLLPSKPGGKIAWHLMAMYGYNAAVYVQGGTQYNKLFYGPSFALGFDHKKSPEKRGYWSLDIILPIRSSEVQDYFDDLKENHNVEFKNGLFPIGISFGYRIVLGS